MNDSNYRHLDVRIGSSWHAYEGQIINVSQIFDHPKYSDANYDTYSDYDVSLLKLAEEINFTDKIQPIALPDEYTQFHEGELCTTAGWGNYVVACVLNPKKKTQTKL